MLEAVKQSPEPELIKDGAMKKITGIVGDLTRRRSRTEQARAAENARATSMSSSLKKRAASPKGPTRFVSTQRAAERANNPALAFWPKARTSHWRTPLQSIRAAGIFIGSPNLYFCVDLTTQMLFVDLNENHVDKISVTARPSQLQL